MLTLDFCFFYCFILCSVLSMVASQNACTTIHFEAILMCKNLKRSTEGARRLQTWLATLLLWFFVSIKKLSINSTLLPASIPNLLQMICAGFVSHWFWATFCEPQIIFFGHFYFHWYSFLALCFVFENYVHNLAT